MPPTQRHLRYRLVAADKAAAGPGVPAGRLMFASGPARLPRSEVRNHYRRRRFGRKTVFGEPGSLVGLFVGVP